MNDPTLTIPFEGSGDEENHWIRLEQVEMKTEASTLAEAADLVDALFGVTPCDNGLGNGGEEFDEDDLPEEADFLDMARERLPLDICDEDEDPTWEAEVDVLRSHQEDAYTLESATAQVVETAVMRKTVTETVEMNGASYDLAWPYAGGISVSGAGAEVAEVRGSTLNLAAPVRGRVRIRYSAVWDRVKLKVRKASWWQEGDRIQQILAGITIAGSSPPRADDSAVVTAFWLDLATSCDVTRPPEDETADAAEIERICNPRRHYELEGECWERVEKINRCNCSGREAKDQPEPEDRPTPCPKGSAPGAIVAVVQEPGEYVDCPGEDKEGLNTPEFFEAHCCASPRANLPRCRETREPYQGGAGIEGGPERWKKLYGDSVRLTPVTPEGGRCGELIKVWAVPESVEAPPVLPGKMTVGVGETFSVTVIAGGRPPFAWSTPKGVQFLGEAGMGFIGIFRAGDSFSGGYLTVMDACGRSASCELVPAGAWRPVEWGTYDPIDPPGQPYSPLTTEWDRCNGARVETVRRWVEFKALPDGTMTWFTYNSVDGQVSESYLTSPARYYDAKSLYAMSGGGRYIAEISVQAYMINQWSTKHGPEPGYPKDRPATCRNFLTGGDDYYELMTWWCDYANNFCKTDSIDADGYLVHDTQNKWDDPSYSQDWIMYTQFVWCHRVARLYERGPC